MAIEKARAFRFALNLLLSSYNLDLNAGQWGGGQDNIAGKIVGIAGRS